MSWLRLATYAAGLVTLLLAAKFPEHAVVLGGSALALIAWATPHLSDVLKKAAMANSSEPSPNPVREEKTEKLSSNE